ncbi:11312_t:CDS:1, partial [Gigaspora rosea]
QRLFFDCTIVKLCGQCGKSNPNNIVNSTFSSPDDNHSKINRIPRREKNAEIAALDNELDYLKRVADSLEQYYSHLSSEISSLKKENSILQKRVADFLEED